MIGSFISWQSPKNFCSKGPLFSCQRSLRDAGTCLWNDFAHTDHFPRLKSRNVTRWKSMKRTWWSLQYRQKWKNCGHEEMPERSENFHPKFSAHFHDFWDILVSKVNAWFLAKLWKSSFLLHYLKSENIIGILLN